MFLFFAALSIFVTMQSVFNFCRIVPISIFKVKANTLCVCVVQAATMLEF